MKSSRPNTRPRAFRPQQELPGDIVADLLGVIRGQFYGDATPKQWHQDRAFLMRGVILWPASWLTRRGVTLPPRRFKEILLEIFNGIKVHGSTGAVKFWPGYLQHCVQRHFAIHGEDYYQEGKCIRSIVERSALAFMRTPVDRPGVDPIEAMAAARDALVLRRRKPVCKPSEPLLPGL